MDKGKLKRAAILLFAKDPRKYFTSAFVQVGRFVSESEVVSTDVIEGNLFTQVEKIIEILRIKYLENRFYYEGLVRKEDMIYPEEALREAVINAVIHRDYLGSHTQLRVYDHKLWLWNAGELPAAVTFEKLKKAHRSCPRNELLADVFFKAGYIEAWGRGTLKMIAACRKNNLPEPEFLELTGGFLVSFPKGEAEKSDEPTEKGSVKSSGKGSVKSSVKITELIQSDRNITIPIMAEQLQLTTRAVEKQIAILQKAGRIRRIGPDKGGHWEVAEK